MEAATAAAGMGLPASVARMQAKAAELAAELELARAGLDKPGTASSSNTADGPASPTAASSTVRLQGTLGAPRRMSQANIVAKSSSSSDAAAQSALMQKLEAQVQMWRGKHCESERELQRHQESYMRREEQLQARLAELEQRLQQAAGHGDADSGAEGAEAADLAADSSRGAGGQHKAGGQKGPPKDQPLTLETVQHQMQQGMEDLLQHQRLQLRAEEAAQLRLFRGRLAEVEAQLAADKRAAAADQDSWMSKTLAVREELARTQEIAVKLDAMYRLAEDEAAQLRVRFKAQEDDRQHLIRQVLGLRRQNQHLQQQATSLQEELDAIISLELDEQQLGLGAQQQQQQQQGGSRPQSAMPHMQTARPLTAGPAGSRPQQQEAAPQWRPMSGTPQQRARPGSSGTPHAGGEAAAGSMSQQQSNSQHAIQQLQKALQCERKQLRQLRAACTAEHGRRNELQTLLLESIQQAKRQYQQAEAAHSMQSQAAAEADAAAACTGPPWKQHQQQRPQTSAGGSGSGSSSRGPDSRVQPSRPSQRPASAAPAYQGSCEHRQVVGTAANAGRSEQAAAAATGSDGVLDQHSWARLLDDLLSRQQVLELLLHRACPDLVAAAQQLHGGHQGASAVPSRGRSGQRQRDQQQQAQVGQQQGQLWAVHNLPQQAAQEGQQGVQQPHEQQEREQLGVCDGDGDMFVIEEDEAGSQATDDSFEQCCAGGQHWEQEAVGQELPEQQCCQQLDSGQQQAEHQVQQQQQQQHTAQMQPPPPPHVQPSPEGAVPVAVRGGAASTAVLSITRRHQAPAAAAVTLGLMSGPVMGSFPVRKLMHSGSGSSSSHSGSSSSLQRARQRRPDSAAASQVPRPFGDGGFALRPQSAAAFGGAAVGPSHGSQHSAWHGHAVMSSPTQQPASGAASSTQQQRLSRKPSGFTAGGSGADSASGLSIRSWDQQESRASQQMLKSFLSSR